MSETTLGLLVLRTSRLEAMLAFYLAIGLSFVEEKHGNGLVHYAAQVGTTVIEFYPAAPQESQDQHGSGATLLGFTVDDLERSLAALMQKNVAMISEPKSTSWGFPATVQDPDGRLLALTQLPEEEEEEW